MKDVLFVGIDVDDNHFHACGVRVSKGKTLKEPVFRFRCKADAGLGCWFEERPLEGRDSLHPTS